MCPSAEGEADPEATGEAGGDRADSRGLVREGAGPGAGVEVAAAAPREREGNGARGVEADVCGERTKKKMP